MEINTFDSSNFNLNDSLLLVFAHPDDEALFFSPLLLTLRKMNCNVTFLCLSNGNYYGKGKYRQDELIKSGEIYQINSIDITVIDDVLLQDGPDSVWSIDKAAEYILSEIHYKNPTIVVTFDRYGISGHSNHISCYNAMKLVQATLITNTPKMTDCPKFLSLETTNIIRKYIGIFDIIPSLYSDNIIILNLNIFVIFLSLWCHYTQIQWYRILFIIFSRYSYINTLIPLQ
jgi:N-acetylglucosaminylphosphatidylinositol deacetylase